ncbi:uncharacterized protein F13E9.13, mitochondrial isoform X2 [Cynoglossus semilaevis]|uniref:uncharacterized protein F13E9.13, mitochondrial isoform X2 n=1 Tax=Cynoglossus semilaevis TaxID=244447 RepID=UPI0007DC9C6D|nr:uncharacterized protein F13E9.13, mitochondrial-like isoform X2 [Cynoglossus semilaevis]XP_024911482.1 uncharacterized protein F13E9.13, mitochondrial-like isoform X2 [Cynoglossus semilaevis]
MTSMITQKRTVILCRLHTNMKFMELFGRLNSVVIGMIHVKALPGSPLSQMKISQIIEQACQEAEVYRDAGIDGLMVENMHDIPYSFTVGPEVYTCMTAVCSAVRRTCPLLPLGVQILSSANKGALSVALASDLDFIRAEGFVFSHVADEGFLNACAGDLLRYRRQIGAEKIQIFTDIKKKHSSHALTSDVDVVETALAAEFFLSDGVIITGSRTGSEADPGELREVSQAVKIPVLVGSGVDFINVDQYLEASGIIIGSHFKKDGHWTNKVDPERVKRFMEKMHRIRK